jgi:hypothetical protein
MNKNLLVIVALFTLDSLAAPLAIKQRDPIVKEAQEILENAVNDINEQVMPFMTEMKKLNQQIADDREKLQKASVELKTQKEKCNDESSLNAKMECHKTARENNITTKQALEKSIATAEQEWHRFDSQRAKAAEAVFKKHNDKLVPLYIKDALFLHGKDDDLGEIFNKGAIFMAFAKAYNLYVDRYGGNHTPPLKIEELEIVEVDETGRRIVIVFHTSMATTRYTDYKIKNHGHDLIKVELKISKLREVGMIPTQQDELFLLMLGCILGRDAVMKNQPISRWTATYGSCRLPDEVELLDFTSLWQN